VLVAPGTPRRPSCIASRTRAPRCRRAEFPVLVRVVDALEEALALLVLRQVQEELDDARAVAVQVVFFRSTMER
jgi:hypothetical protein